MQLRRDNIDHVVVDMEAVVEAEGEEEEREEERQEEERQEEERQEEGQEREGQEREIEEAERVDEEELEREAERLARWRRPEGFGERREVVRDEGRQTRCCGRWMRVVRRGAETRRLSFAEEGLEAEEVQRARHDILSMTYI